MGFSFELLQLAQRWLQATTALLQIGPQVSPQMSPPRAAYYAACMVMAEQTYAIPWARIAAVIQHESQWRERLVGRTNDYGLGQHHCPSFFCPRHPTGSTRAALLEPCSNIQLTAQELALKRRYCKNCRNYVRLYNPGNPRYAKSIARWEAKFVRAARTSPASLPLAWDRALPFAFNPFGQRQQTTH